MSQFRSNGHASQSTNGHAAQNEESVGEVINRPRATTYKMKPRPGDQVERFDDPTLEVISRLEQHGYEPRSTGVRKWEALCPAHYTFGGHKNFCLEVTDTTQFEGCMFVCQAHRDACSLEARLAPLHLVPIQLRHISADTPPLNGQSRNGKPKKTKERTFTHAYKAVGGRIKEWGQPTAVYRYTDDFAIFRWDLVGRPKELRPASRNGDGLWGMCDPDEDPLPLYGMRELADLPDKSYVWVVEGEKCVNILRGLGIPAVTNAHGSSDAKRADWSGLARFRVVLNPDYDESGEKHMEAVAGFLGALPTPPEVRVVRFDELPPAGDVEQYIERFRIMDDWAKVVRENLEAMAELAPIETPPVKPETSSKERLEDLGIFDMDEDEIENVDWIEEDVIGTGGITIIAGEGGLGKSQIAMSFAATISNGDRFPCSDHNTDRGYVLVMSSEDKKKSVIMPRLKAAGADLSMVKEYKCYEKVTDEKGKKTLVRRSLQDYEWFDRVLAERSDTRLVIMDSIKSFLGPGVNENSELDVRNVLEPISKILEERNVALLGISHTNKGGNDTSANNLLSGTQAYRNIVRCLFYTFMDNEDNERLFLAANKNNEGALHKTFVYRITPTTVKKRNSELVVKTSRVDWEDELSDLTCNDCLARHRDRSRGVKRRHVKKEEVIAFLRQIVNEGPIRSKDLDTRAIQAGYTINHVIDNVKEAGIRAKKVGEEWWKYVGEWTGTREYAREDGNAVPY